jgi:hypothetical protein
MPTDSDAPIDKKTLQYYKDLIWANDIEYADQLIRRLSTENPHIPPWIYSSSIGYLGGGCASEIAFAFDTGELAWVKNPSQRIKCLGGSILSISDELDAKYQGESIISISDELDEKRRISIKYYNELVEINPHVPPWCFFDATVDQFANRVVTAFNEGEIVWIKNPKKRNNLLTNDYSKNSTQPNWKIIFPNAIYGTVFFAYAIWGWKILESIWEPKRNDLITIYQSNAPIVSLLPTILTLIPLVVWVLISIAGVVNVINSNAFESVGRARKYTKIIFLLYVIYSIGIFLGIEISEPSSIESVISGFWLFIITVLSMMAFESIDGGAILPK